MIGLTQINSDSQPPKCETFVVVDKDGKIWGTFATQAAAKQYIQYQETNESLINPEVLCVTIGPDAKKDLSEDIVNVPLRVTPIAVTKSIPVNVEAVYKNHDGALRTRDLTQSGQSVIELAGRTCYAAYGRKNEKTDSHEGYIGNMISQAHWSVVEHASVTFHIQGISRAETHELVRHRHLSFCLSGDTKVYLDRPNRNGPGDGKKSPSQTRTLRQLWEMWQDRRRTYVKTATIRSVSPEGHVIHQHIKNVYYSGEKDVYEVELENGYKIKSTLDHLFMVDPGEEKFSRLGDLSVGDEVVVNGRKVELDHINNDPMDNRPENVQPLCSPCHHAKTMGTPPMKVYRSKIESITKVGVEETFDLEMGGYHNFVANGFVVHNSQESQRYVVVQRPYRVALHPTLLKAYDEEDLLDTLICDFEYVETLYNELREKGYNRKQASEAARAFLPNAAATEITVTGNLRSWVEFVSKRDSDAADAGIRKLAQAIGDQLSVMFPEVFGEDARPIWDETCEQKGHTHGD